MNRERKHGAVRLRRVLTCAGPLLLATSTAAWAQESPPSYWGLDLGVRYTDNVGRTDTDEESEKVGIAGLNFALNVDRRRVDAQAAGNLRYLHYIDNTFDDELNGGVNGALQLSFVPERFLWVAEDNYGQVARNRQLADNPNNRQDINVFSTGPELTLPLGSRTTFQLTGRWSDAYYEEGNQDSETVTGSAALIRQLSAATALSLNGSYSEVNFDEDQIFTDYKVEQAFLRLALTGARTTFTLDGGGSRLEQQGGASKSESVLARLDLTRQVGARSRLRLVAGTAPSNTSQTFRRDQELGGVDVGSDGAVVSGDSFQSDYGYLTFATDWERSALTILLSARSEDHEVFSTLDRDQYRAILTYSHELTRNLSVDMRGTYLDEKFTETGFSFDQWGAGVGMRWQLGRNISLRATYDHFVGSSDDGTRDFTENRAYIGISYLSNQGQ
ncbi:MAG TPA: outer membrane beta-barrel protein [Steroidobacteraceae bacterium]|jgi:hypothetical protein